jgi:hypothetical protein
MRSMKRDAKMSLNAVNELAKERRRRGRTAHRRPKFELVDRVFHHEDPIGECLDARERRVTHPDSISPTSNQA